MGATKTVAKKTVAKKKSVMKTMKVAKKPVMKVMKKKEVKKSVTARGVMRKSLVFSGARLKTPSGLKKADFKKNKDGKIVSVKLSKQGKRNYSNISGWTDACKEARAALNVTGFVAIKKGTALYK